MIEICLPYSAGQTVFTVIRNHVGRVLIEKCTVVQYAIKSSLQIEICLLTPTQRYRYVPLKEVYATEAQAEEVKQHKEERLKAES
ncbi:MAG: hypothetical protein ACI4MS_04685 [Candidatus Coproplasma sp.]